MDPEFWHQRWARGEIGFHEGRANEMLVRHFAALALSHGARVFVPLCGKSRDLGWLRTQGMRVAGAELSAVAVEALFADLGLTPSIAPVGRLILHQAEGIDIFVGDIFDLTREVLGKVDAVHDRAALCALPPDMRQRYAAHLTDVTAGAAQLLNCFEYDQSLMRGPPFSVQAEEVARLYSGAHRITLLEREALAGGLRGRPAHDAVWHLR